MRKLLGLALVALALTLPGVSTFAAPMKEQTKQVATSLTEMTGEITHIKGHTITLKDEAGNTHHVRAAHMKELEGLKVGEKVTVNMEKGKASSIQKVESTTPGESAPYGK